MRQDEQLGGRDGKVPAVRRLTLWAATGSLAAAAGAAAIFGVGQPDTQQPAGTSATTSGSADSTSSTGSTGSGGFQRSEQTPGSSSGPGAVTSGGS